MKRAAICLALLVCWCGLAWADYPFYSEDFSGGIPGDWTLVNGGDANTWRIGLPSGGAAPTLTGDYLVFDVTMGGDEDDTLDTAAVDCTDWVNVNAVFDFNLDWSVSSNFTFTVEVSNDGGTTWHVVYAHPTNDVFEDDFAVDVSTYADGEDDVRLRLAVVGKVANYIALDNLRLTGNAPSPLLLVLPKTSEIVGEPGDAIVHAFTVYNETGTNGLVEFALIDDDWPTTAPASVSIDDGDYAEIEVTVDIPDDVLWATQDEAQLQASRDTYTDTVDFTTAVDGGLWDALDPSTATGVYYHGAAELDGVIYFIGGVTDVGDASYGPTGQMQSYDTLTDTWDFTLPDVPLPVFSAVVVVFNGKIYVVGGYGDMSSNAVDTVQIYDPATKGWTSGTVMPSPRGGAAGATVEGFLYVIGGRVNSDLPVDCPVQAYDINLDSWTTLTETCPLTGGVGHFDGTNGVVIDNQIYYGGHGVADNDGWFVYDPGGGSFVELASIPTGAGYFKGYTVVFDGLIYYWSGGTLVSPLNATWTYDPDLDSWTDLAAPQIVAQMGGAGAVALVPGDLFDDTLLFSFGGRDDAYLIDPVPFEALELDHVCNDCEIDGVCWSEFTLNPDNECQMCDPDQSTTAWTDLTGDTCDDGVWCNGTDQCDAGACTDHQYPDNGGGCDDELWCNGTETCNEVDDVCDTTGDPCPDDGLFCNGAESCDEDNDQCLHAGDPCPDDGLFCNGEEYCDEDNDVCANYGNPCPDDGTFCNGIESCDEDNDECVHSGDPCPDDTLFCTGEESCNEQTDVCESSGDPCNEDEECNELTDACDEILDDDTADDDDDDDDINPDDDDIDPGDDDINPDDDDTADEDTGGRDSDGGGGGGCF